MIKKIKIVKVDYKYCDFLRKYDSKVSFNAGIKELRPFVGVLFDVDGCEYFAPLSSPKPKHLKIKNNIDILKIDGGKYGVINFNNMIPVTSNNYTLIDLNKVPSDISEQKRHALLRKQLDWLNKNSYNVRKRALKIYSLYNSGRLDSRIKDRCCNFKLLEKKCAEYNSSIKI